MLVGAVVPPEHPLDTSGWSRLARAGAGVENHSVSAPPPLLYRCTVCEADLTYEAVRHIACCRACGGSLLRVDAAPPRAPAATPSRRVKRRGGRLASPLPAR